MGIIRDRFNKIVAVEYKANTLNNVNDVSMLNLEDGECSQLLNVDIIDDGAVQRRKGYVSVLTGDIHSGWSSQTKDIAYFVNGVLSLMYLKQDAEILDKTKATEYDFLFKKDLDIIKQEENALEDRLNPNNSLGAFR